jgi:hypothetical protein
MDNAYSGGQYCSTQVYVLEIRHRFTGSSSSSSPDTNGRDTSTILIYWLTWDNSILQFREGISTILLIAFVEWLELLSNSNRQCSYWEEVLLKVGSH